MLDLVKLAGKAGPVNGMREKEAQRRDDAAHRGRANANLPHIMFHPRQHSWL